MRAMVELAVSGAFVRFCNKKIRLNSSVIIFLGVFCTHWKNNTINKKARFSLSKISFPILYFKISKIGGRLFKETLCKKRTFRNMKGKQTLPRICDPKKFLTILSSL